MVTPVLPSDFKEFLLSLSSNGVRYLLLGGYAVGYYGYVRATADIDVWIALDPLNAAKTTKALRDFGFGVEGLSDELFLQEHKVVRMGVPPFRIEIRTSIDGGTFEECYRNRVTDTIDGIQIDIISLDDLKRNKRAAGRGKDLVDLEHLP